VAVGVVAGSAWEPPCFVIDPRCSPMAAALWSVVLFVAMWLMLIGFGVVVAIAVRRLERDDGPWRRGL
jgi:hypothetical protein